jgi:hypothetical protein
MLTPKQYRYLEALLQHTTSRAACKVCKISERTGRNWRGLPEFRQRLAEAQQELFREAIARLKTSLPRAATTLVKCLKCKEPVDRIRAARACFDHCFRGVDLVDIQQRLDRLEGLFH